MSQSLVEPVATPREFVERQSVSLVATHNQAERALWRAVLRRRKSFGTQSETGSKFIERILTVVTTLRQQGGSVPGYLKKACTADVAGENPTGFNPPVG